MRQSKKQIHSLEIMESLLASCQVGRLGTIAKDGRPLIKPLNFAYQPGKVYFHSAREGEKMEDIRRDGRVCFEVDLPIAFVRAKEQACQASYLYRSVIIKGRARIVVDEAERVEALGLLMRKYQPEGAYGDFPAEKLALAEVVRIDVEEMTGKEDLGKGGFKEQAEALLGLLPQPARVERE